MWQRGVRGIARSAILVMAALALAWGRPDDGRAQVPKPGGVLHFAVVTEPPNYDCHGNTSFGVSHAIFPHYSRLLRYDGDWQSSRIAGDVAETWTISADGLVYTFKLLPNVRFHDGTLLTSRDVRASYERIVSPAPGIVSARQNLYRDIVGIETPNDDTVIFRLKQPNGGMLDAFASPWNCIYSAARLSQDPKFPETTILGTGPFVFVGHTRGQILESKKFDGYFRQGLPYLDGFKAAFVKPAGVVTGLTGGLFDIEFRGLAPPERDQVAERLKGNAAVREGPWNAALILTFNTKRKPFDDVRFRQALSQAIDRWEGAEALSKVSLLKHVGGFTRPGSTFALPSEKLAALPGFSRDIDLARTQARQLLAQLGTALPSITLLNRDLGQPYLPGGAFVVQQWKQLGLETEHRPLEQSRYYEAISRGDFDVAIDFISDFSDDPSFFYIRLLSAGKSAVSYAQHDDTVLDELFEQQLRTLDIDHRRQIAHAFEERALTQAHTVPLLWWQRTVVHHKKVNGWRLHASHHLGQDLAEVWLDQ